jgi:DNA-binding protein YbaB
VNNDDAQHDFTHVFALAQEQMRDLSIMQQRRSQLTAKASAADGAVEVTVDAQRMVTKTVIDESYLDEFELADLGGHITSAAQQASRELERLTAELIAPLTARRQEISSLAGLVTDAPDFGDMLAGLSSAVSANDQVRHAHQDDGGTEESPRYPTLRS